MATSSRSAERFKYGICLNDECPMCKQKTVQQIPMRKDLVCQNPECGKPLRECPPPKKPGRPVGLIIGIIAFLLVGGLVGGGIWAYNSGLFDKISGKETPQQPNENDTQKDGEEGFFEEPQQSQTPKPVQPILIEELAIDTKDFTLTVGEKKTVACTATPANNEETVTWKSSDESIATVDAKTGEVKAIKAGSANIMAQTDQSGLSKSVMVTVKEKAVTPPANPQPSWGRYSGERNKNGKPHGQGVLTITRSHTINGEQALVGETITGVFKDGYVNMGKWNKLDGNVVIVKDLKIL